jgi:hypothetical protein
MTVMGDLTKTAWTLTDTVTHAMRMAMEGTDEDGQVTPSPPRYYRVTVTEPGRLVVPAFPLGARERGIVNVRIFIYTKDGTMLRIRIDRVQR